MFLNYLIGPNSHLSFFRRLIKWKHVSIKSSWKNLSRVRTGFSIYLTKKFNLSGFCSIYGLRFVLLDGESEKRQHFFVFFHNLRKTNCNVFIDKSYYLFICIENLFGKKIIVHDFALVFTGKNWAYPHLYTNTYIWKK